MSNLEDYFFQFLGPSGVDMGRLLPSGKSTFPFSFTLPQDLPSSVEGYLTNNALDIAFFINVHFLIVLNYHSAWCIFSV